VDELPPSERPEGDLTRQTVAGIQWSYLSSFAGGLLQIGMMAVMARLLTPAAFGLIALAGVVLRFVDHFARAGVGQALIQKVDLTPTDVRAAFTLSVVSGTTFAIIAAGSAQFAARLVNEPEVVPVLRWLSLAMVINGLGATATALLRRRLRFKELALIDLAAYIVGYTVVGLSMALTGAGVYALIGAMLTQFGVRATASYLLVRHPLSPTRSRDSIASILSFGGRVSVIGFFEFLQTNLDALAVGRSIGAAQLGLYNRARMIGEVPTSHLTLGLSRVLFPSFSAIQLEPHRLKNVYVSAVGAASAIVLPLNAGMAVAAPEIVLVLLGPQWVGAINVLPWLLLTSTLTLLGYFSGIVAEAQAALNAKLVVAVVSTATLGLLLLAAQGRSLAAYGAAVAGAAAVSHMGYLTIISRTLKTSIGSLLQPYVRSGIGAILVAAAIAAIRMLLVNAGAAASLTLAIQVFTGAIGLALLLRFGPLSTYREDFVTRLTNAGLLTKAGPVGRSLRWFLGPPKGRG
jgi:lipopolysaccharide exporter